MEHNVIPLGEIHKPHNWEFANENSRLSALNIVQSEVGCLSLQLDSGTYWRLVSAAPLIWSPVNTGFDRNFQFAQSPASAVWLITHNLGKYPSVTVVDSAGEQVEGRVEFIDANSVRVTFSAAFTGNAYLN